MRFILSSAAVLLLAQLASAQKGDSARLYFTQAQTEKSAGRLLESHKALVRSRHYDTTNAEVNRAYAQSLFELRRYSEARKQYLTLYNSGKRDTAVLRRLLDLSFNLRQFDDAIRFAKEIKVADPSAKTAAYIGRAYYYQDNAGEAVKYLKIAAGENPADADIPYLIGRAYAEMSSYNQATPYLEQAIAAQPNNAMWIYETALVYYAANNAKKTLEYMLLAGERGLKRDAAYLDNLGTAYIDAKQTEKGLEVLKEALKMRPTDMGLLNTLAEANYDLKRWDAAIDYWDQMLAIDKTKASALYMIGMAYIGKGDKGKGQALADRAIAMDPSLARNKKEVKMGGF